MRQYVMNPSEHPFGYATKCMHYLLGDKQQWLQICRYNSTSVGLQIMFEFIK